MNDLFHDLASWVWVMLALSWAVESIAVVLSGG